MARKILEDNRDKLDLMAEALMQYETIDAAQLKDIMEGRKPRPPKDWGDDGPTSGSGRPVDDPEPQPSGEGSPDDESGNRRPSDPLGGSSGL